MEEAAEAPDPVGRGGRFDPPLEEGRPVGVGEGIRPPRGSTLHAVGPGGAALPVVAMRVGAPSGVGEPLREGGIRW